MLARMASLAAEGVTVVALLALSDEGAPSYDHEHAAALAELGIPAFACTPDAFPDLLALAIDGAGKARICEVYVSTTSLKGMPSPARRTARCSMT